jgi:hypothetical protein
VANVNTHAETVPHPAPTHVQANLSGVDDMLGFG